ncbi:MULTISPECIES: LysR family transcriptional regulator [Paracoccaceae]|jgi:DNA-binding transcriptional LysR family regulator|uniref:LysR family transcriptional regulator n=1 Tax=Rhodophyticola porphyridii TaxID=1852017 RepID=A0A3L9YA48_9RHOB|nr:MULTISPECIES: LysR family transcriptional regulator [Paracoccaceae]MBO6604328.1 LysR family transcriptional regulator [Roseicyclus sp.]MBO6624640.1 LysR family transcriptional regulator [Roseicyclus sp.]MBO6921632.1 LysR family transcriptional regulator [Roseicyclus sp.]RMA43997.1 LysR family transcriptional regulator [Rhodophyticola porphyridii]
MSFDHWDEIRTAYQVARMGTVSGAAEVLGVHHATVIRHIDALEGRLGAKLFQRHARGYTATEAGQDLLSVASGADDQFTQLAGRIKGRGNEVTGELIVTSLESLSPLFIPAIARFQDQHSELRVRLVTDNRLFRLEYGEAHVAIRAGALPEQPDNIVQPFFTQTIRLVAHKDYVARYGALDDTNLDRHRFIGSSVETPRAPFLRWLTQMVPETSIYFRTTEMRAVKDAIMAGIGIGFLPAWDRDGTEDLVDMLPSLEEWSAKLWLVTHMDLHRTAKVQTFLRFLKEEVKTWPVD